LARTSKSIKVFDFVDELFQVFYFEAVFLPKHGACHQKADSLDEKFIAH
jgi:hypothetical protein